MKWIIILHICLGSILGFAQPNAVYRQISTTDGLPSKIVYDIKILKNQLLYIAHEKGLSSFDGLHFVNYPNKDYPLLAVSNIMQAADGSIFCKSFNNIIFRLLNDSLQFECNINHSMAFDYTRVIQNTLCGVTGDSVYFYNSIDKKLVYKKISDSRPLNSMSSYSIVVPNRSETNGGLVIFDQVLNFALLSQKTNGLHIIDRQNQLVSKAITRQENLAMLVQQNDCVQLNTNAESSNVFINNVVQIDSTIWICTNTGAYQYNPQKSNSLSNQILADHNISFVQKDFENNYWFSSTNDGLFMISNFNIHALPGIENIVTSISGNHEKLFVGDIKGEVRSSYFNTGKTQIEINSGRQKSVESIFFDSLSNSLFLSSDFLYQKKNGVVQKDGLVLKDVVELNGHQLLACNAGLYLYINPNQAPSWLQQFANPYNSKIHGIKNLYKLNFINQKVNRICVDKPHADIYFSTQTTLYQFNHTMKAPLILCESRGEINDICWFDNQLFVATKDKGLCVMKQGKLVQFVDHDHYTFKSNITRLHVFNQQLWILSEHAIYKYTSDSTFRYSYPQGLPMQQINDLFVHNRTVYLNCVKEILFFDENMPVAAPQHPILLINNIYAGESKFSSSSNISLNHTQNNLLINYSLIAFNNSMNTTIEYTINDGHPIRSSTALRTITLPSLEDGSYIVKMYTVVDGQVDQKYSAAVSFNIQAPYWKSYWFMALIVGIIGLIIYWRVGQMLQKQKKENALIQSKLLLEKELERSMLSSIKSQMNPHFLFNALNTIQSYIYSNDKLNASIYISKFSDLTRSILEMSTKDTISLEEEIKSLRLYLELEKMRFEDSFDYVIQTDPHIQTDFIKIPSMLVQPYVENAIKHGLLHKKTNRLLHLYFEKNNDLLVITIDDNGIGRKRSEELNRIKNRQHTSFAMDANKKRLDILKNNFSNIEFDIIDKLSPLGEATGTKVVIKLPV